jgi:hypothetical glycosyl hydrolase
MTARMTYGDWLVEQKGFDQRYLGKTESIMTLGNGYIGIRSAEEETYTGEKRNSFVAGTFNQFDANEVTELPNVPDFMKVNFTLNDQRFSLAKGETLDYKKSLELKTGEVRRSFVWKFKDIHVRFTFRRFVSKANRHLIANTIRIENLSDQPLKVEANSGIDGQVTNSGSQHFTEGVKGLVDDRYLQMATQTTQSNIDFVLTLTHRLSAADVKQMAEIGRRRISLDFAFEIPAGKNETIERRVAVCTSIDNDIANHAVAHLQRRMIELLKSTDEISFDELLSESAAAWEEIWERHPIEIESEAPIDQLAIRFAIFHLHAMTPAHDERMNIGAKGLSGEGYKGHTFWDTEIFMLPYFTFTHPEIARKLLTYRYHGLEGAHRKAASNGYQGAQYPWEAAHPEDGEVTPVWGAVDIVTGQATKIWTGFIDYQITSDVAFAVKQYLDVTGDEAFAIEKGYEILIDTARFWASRVEKNTDGNAEFYEITDVIGPDEYKEHVNNNAYTNYTAAWNMRFVSQLIDQLQAQSPEVYQLLNEKFDLPRLKTLLDEKRAKLFLPRPTADGIIPQDDTYLTKPTLDLTKYKSADGVDSLFRDYNLEQINQLQVTKQADVLLLLLLFEGLFDKALKLKNFDYYEPKTTHDSSLSLSTHAILSADLGKLDQSYAFFRKAIAIDLGTYMKSSDAGIHAASLGGIWQMIVFGYGGVRMIDGKLRIEPHLPEGWTRLKFGFDYRGQSLTVTVTKDSFEVVSADTHGNDLYFLSKGEKYSLQKHIIISHKEGK